MNLSFIVQFKKGLLLLVLNILHKLPKGNYRMNISKSEIKDKINTSVDMFSIFLYHLTSK